jgi:hypothetical protein
MPSLLLLFSGCSKVQRQSDTAAAATTTRSTTTAANTHRTPVPKAPPTAVPTCGLAQPKLSGDACQQDSDCGPSEPCHARACVTAAKAQPPAPATVCTRQLVCDSIDVNRCGCFKGQCALIPPKTTAKTRKPRIH